MSRVLVGRCTTCRQAWHPVPPVCPSCRGVVEEASVAGRGRVVSWTRVDRPPSGFEAPQRVALVALGPDEAGHEVLVLAAATEGALQVGTEVQVIASADGRLLAEPR